MKLIRIDRGGGEMPVFAETIRREFTVLQTENYDGESPLRKGTFFTVEDQDAGDIVRVLAEKNPGLEVQVYNLEQVGICPAGELALKRVTEDGILPN